MSPELLFAGLGGLLLLTGILGGGFEIRELRIPKIGVLSRGISSVVGLGLLLLALGMAVQPAPVPPHPPGPDEPVTFTVHDELGDGQLSEQVTVVLAGRRVAELTVNGEFPAASVEVTVPSRGRQDFTLSASSRHVAADGTEVVVEGSGQGAIDVDNGDAFDVMYADNGQARNLALVERRAGRAMPTGG